MKTLTFLEGQLAIALADDGGTSLESGLERETCPSCGQAECMNDCDGSQGADENNEETEEDALGRQRFNAGLDTIESFMLALVSSGAITESEDPKVNEALATCLDAIGNNF